MFCTQCGTMLMETHIYCFKCGTKKITEIQKSPFASQQSPFTTTQQSPFQPSSTQQSPFQPLLIQQSSFQPSEAFLRLNNYKSCNYCGKEMRFGKSYNGLYCSVTCYRNDNGD